jgi:hypothetical protein
VQPCRAEASGQAGGGKLGWSRATDPGQPQRLETPMNHTSDNATAVIIRAG